MASNVNVAGLAFKFTGDTADLDKKVEASAKKLNKMGMTGDEIESAMAGAKYYVLATAASFAAMVVPVVLATNAVKDFDTEVTRAVSLGGDELAGYDEELMSLINKLAINYGVAADDVASAISSIVKSGWDSFDEIQSMIVPAVELAKSENMALADSVDMLNTAMHVWGTDAGYTAERTAEIMHTASIESAMSIDDLANAFAYSASSAKIAGIGLEEYAAIVASLSQIGVNAGEAIGTLFSRMETDTSGELQSILGRYDIYQTDAAGTRTVNTTNLMNALMNATQQQLNNLDMWGVRGAKNFYSLRNAAGSYAEILQEIETSQTTLGKDAEEMSMTLSSMWTSIKETLLSGIRTGQGMDSMKNAYESLLAVASDPRFSSQIAKLVESSADFVANTAPELLDTGVRLLSVAQDMQPVLENLSYGFKNILAVLSYLPAQLDAVLVAVVIGNKIMPAYTTAMQEMALAMGATAMSAAILKFQMGGFMTMCLIAMAASNPLVKALAAITAAVIALAMAMTVLNIVSGGAGGTISGGLGGVKQLLKGGKIVSNSVAIGKNAMTLGKVSKGTLAAISLGAIGGVVVPSALALSTNDWFGGNTNYGTSASEDDDTSTSTTVYYDYSTTNNNYPTVDNTNKVSIVKSH